MTKKLLFIILSLFLLTTPALATNISNADIDDEDMADITDWTDSDTGTAVSSQVTFDGASCLKLDTGANTGSNASRNQDLGSYGARTVFSIKVYCDAIGVVTKDIFRISMWHTTTAFKVQFASDGLFIGNSLSELVEVGTNLVTQDTWQEWTFDVTWGATCDVYLNQILVASDIDCAYPEEWTEGLVTIQQTSTDNANRISYVDWEKAGSDFAVSARRIIFIQ